MAGRCRQRPASRQVAGVPDGQGRGPGRARRRRRRIPDFAGNQRVYLSFAEAGPNGTSGAALGYGTLDPRPGRSRGIDGFKVIWRQQPKVTGDGHFSHRIAFAPDGTIFLSSGERQKMTPAQDSNGNLGKIIHLTAEGRQRRAILGVAADRAQFYAWATATCSASRSRPTGGCGRSRWARKGGDEVNLIEPGKNYGWPSVSNGSHYDGRDIPDHPTRPGFAAAEGVVEPVDLAGRPDDLFGRPVPASGRATRCSARCPGKALIRVDIDGDKARKADQWAMGARIRAVDKGPTARSICSRTARAAGGC